MVKPLPTGVGRFIRAAFQINKYDIFHNGIIGSRQAPSPPSYCASYHDQMRSFLADIINANNYARRLGTLKGFTPFEYISGISTKEPERFILNLTHQLPGLNTWLKKSKQIYRNKEMRIQIANTYFGDFKAGRLRRLSFLGYTLLIVVLLSAFIIISFFTIIGVEKIYGGDLTKAPNLIRYFLGIPYALTSATVLFALFTAGLNITAKRARDIGLSGWYFVAGLIIVSVLASIFISLFDSLSIGLLVGLLLVLIPGNIIK